MEMVRKTTANKEYENQKIGIKNTHERENNNKEDTKEKERKFFKQAMNPPPQAYFFSIPALCGKLEPSPSLHYPPKKQSVDYFYSKIRIYNVLPIFSWFFFHLYRVCTPLMTARCPGYSK